MRYQYDYVVTSPEGFVQRVAVNLLPHGYIFYSTATIPERKDPLTVDRKLLAYYGIAITPWARARQKTLGEAKLQYIRFDRQFVILATHGRHRFFEEEKVFDVRIKPIKFLGYSIGQKNGHSSVRLRLEEYRRLKKEYVGMATHLSKEWTERKFMAFPYPSYSPIRRQAFNILRAVNRSRKSAGLPPAATSCIRIKRNAVKPFEPIP